MPANFVSACALVQLQHSGQGLCAHFDSVPNVIAINVLLDTSAAVVHLYGAHNYCDDLELRSTLDPGGMKTSDRCPS